MKALHKRYSTRTLRQRARFVTDPSNGFRELVYVGDTYLGTVFGPYLRFNKKKSSYDWSVMAPTGRVMGTEYTIERARHALLRAATIKGMVP